MADYLLRIWSKEAGVHGLACLSTDLVSEAVVDCHFCHERYVFERDALEAILDELEEAALLSLFDEEEPT